MVLSMIEAGEEMEKEFRQQKLNDRNRTLTPKDEWIYWKEFFFRALALNASSPLRRKLNERNTPWTWTGLVLGTMGNAAQAAANK